MKEFFKNFYARSILILCGGLIFSVQTFAQDSISVEITSPTHWQHFDPCMDITLSATAMSKYADVRDVRFFVNKTYIGIAKKEPYELIWENVPTGGYYVVAKVKDRANNQLESKPVYITVGRVIHNNKIINGEFTCRTWPWTLATHGTADYTFRIERDGWLSDSTCAEIAINDGSDTDWHIQLTQQVGLDSGHIYQISFMAEAVKEKPIAINFQENGNDWTVYWWQGVVVDRADYYGPFEYFCNDTDPTTHFKFILGANDIDIYIDDVQMVDLTPLAVESFEVARPDNYELKANFPNPFNPETLIEYQLGQADQVNLKIFNVRGEEIVSLVNAEQAAGVYQVKWDGRNRFGQFVSAGVYIYQIETDHFIESRKMLLLK